MENMNFAWMVPLQVKALSGNSLFLMMYALQYLPC